MLTEKFRKLIAKCDAERIHFLLVEALEITNRHSQGEGG